ncbi:hypothetical protein SMB34_17260 [Thalassospira permensis NBRC 106175]|uniref:Uncharacterized protein n=1 Tax=Thalassospira permensis NBRC 106175 TaxID=1353532 RepID=A0ABR4TNR3_9PROT|nr:hypothetical protein SMB34_17260 [Thalassospira permensis NBRC 106175]
MRGWRAPVKPVSVLQETMAAKKEFSSGTVGAVTF